MLCIHTQLSSFAKQAVVICSIVATLLWCSGMIMCAIVCRNLHSDIIFILNAEISQFSQHLGAMPPDPRIWNCLLSQIRTPHFNISAYGPDHNAHQVYQYTIMEMYVYTYMDCEWLSDSLLCTYIIMSYSSKLLQWGLNFCGFLKYSRTIYVAMHKENLSAKLYLETTFSMEIQQNMKTLVSEILRLHFTYSYHYNM